jgi:hypothetical protein
MYAELVTVTVILGCIPCIVHSWMEKEKWHTLSFFIGGFVFGIVRENIVFLIGTLYYYPDHPLYIGYAPLIAGFSWSAAFYSCTFVGKRLVEAFTPKYQENMLVIPVMAALVTAALSLPVEVAGSAPLTSWWVWPPEAIRVFYEMPAIVPFGWGGAAFLFILFYQWVNSKDMAPDRKAIYFIVLTLLVIILHLIYLLIVRSVIVLLLG